MTDLRRPLQPDHVDTVEPVVTLRRAVVRVGGRRILGPIDLRVMAQERWVMLGPNGSGKTTLLTIAGARRQPSSGEVTVLGVTFGEGDIRSLHPRIGHCGHTLTEMMPPNMSVLDVVLTGKRSSLVTWFEGIEAADRDRAKSRLAEVGAAELWPQPFALCSQGERQRVLLARALFGQPELLILDEPSAGLDFPARERLVRALEGSVGPGSPTTLLATHHLEEVPATTTHAALLREGLLVDSGPVEQVLTAERLQGCFEIPLEVGRRNGRWWAVPPAPTSSP